jgi:hypothetical protein
MLFLQTGGIFWVVLSSLTIFGGVWIIRKERAERKNYDDDSDCAFEANKPD